MLKRDTTTVLKEINRINVNIVESLILLLLVFTSIFWKTILSRFRRKGNC